jgi:hypothetical protein
VKDRNRGPAPDATSDCKQKGSGLRRPMRPASHCTLGFKSFAGWLYTIGGVRHPGSILQDRLRFQREH